MNQKPPLSIEKGAAIIAAFVKTLPEGPGVYRMLDEKGTVLYVGKAKALKKRVVSYTKWEKLPRRLQLMVSQTRDMVFIATHTETEALLLEANLIKKLGPRYNILLRDDKSFPYILITGDHDFPLLVKHRGAQKRKGEYFGPFASGLAVNSTILTLQKAFMLRNCSDNVFAQRKRPCLQYHIKRCTAPCVGYVNKDEYAAQVDDARAFLEGKSRDIQEKLAAQMQKASTAQDYETAAELRDRIRALTSVQAHQDINSTALGDADVIGIHKEGSQSCVQVFSFRGGQNFGNRASFPRHDAEDSEADILSAFIAQFYEGRSAPPAIITSHVVAEKKLLEDALNEQKTGRKKITITHAQRGEKQRIIAFAVRNAKNALEREQLRLAGEKTFLESIAKLFDMDAVPERIEIYDNSHTGGTNMVSAMVVAGPEGLRKNAYRKFNIKQSKAADDYAMMREVMTRRFARAIKDGLSPQDPDWPDLVLIDGGKGQLGAAMEALEELGIAGDVTLAAIAKGPDRNAGRENFYLPGREPFMLPPNDPALHYLQRLRDEAHRFAIGAHRTRRAKQAGTSPIDSIPGIGAKRRKALLLHFGSGRDVATASLRDLQAVEGISKTMAERIHSYFHEDS